ncbi:penicillin-binding protein, beta-lactamase class C [Rheinheimera sp. A13L]|uniref:serine hydrolase domain-containing protein n=1 Tax=Rheinheimera sp. A13L TaxID=506534 RepID=UPI0002124DDD|nr:serine hydrolase [Rheinheimera sp. A13L]EGM76333.1 penicillin-binding protein, beta-lactamase class C [Rheinheimera sp. A13L]
MLFTAGKRLIQRAVLCGAFLPALAQSMPSQDNIQFHQHKRPDPALPVQRPAAQGLNEQILHQLLSQLQDKTTNGYQQVHSLLLYKSGALVLELYQKGNNDFINFEQGIKVVKGSQDFVWTADKPHYVASVTKAVTATLTGIALQQTGLTVDTTLAQLLPQHPVIKADPLKASISLHQLLSMQAGFVWDEWTGQDLVKLWQQQNFVYYLLQQPNTGPGKSWAYNSALPNLVLQLLQQQLKQQLQPWAKQQLFDKLGVTNYRWDTQPDGVPEGSARLWLTPRDMLKLGILYLQQGQWQGEQLLPLGWVQQMTSRHAKSPAGDYGYYFWLRQQDGVSYYTAEGDGGQYIAVFPTLDMVLVLTQGNYQQWALYKTQADLIIQQLILSSKAQPGPNRS